MTQTFTVHIYASDTPPPFPSIPGPNGANIQNCGAVTHIDPGSSVLCTLGGQNGPSVIYVSSDKADQSAMGSYQILQKPASKRSVSKSN